MANDNQSLLDEAQAASATASRGRAVSGWLVADRRQLLPYMSVGGAFVGSLAGIMSTGAGEGLAIGLAAGVGAGMAVGWATLALAHRLLPPQVSRLPMRVVRAVLALPSYVTSGLVASLTMVVLGGRTEQLLTPVLGTLFGLGVLGLILVPINLMLARRSGPSQIKGGTLREAIGQTWSGATESPGPGSGFGRASITAILAVVWLLVATFGVLGLMAVLNSFAPSAYSAAFDSFGAPIGIALLITWLAIIFAGTRFTVRLVIGDRSRRRPLG